MDLSNDRAQPSVLYRNRGYLAFCGAVGITLVSLIISDWQPPRSTSTSLSLVNSGNRGASWIDAEADVTERWIIANCSNQQTQLAILDEGALIGSSALSSSEKEDLSRWCPLPIIDHPEMENWSNQMEQVYVLARSRDTSSKDIIEASLSLPNSALYVNPLIYWLEEDPTRGKELLDAIATSSILDHSIQRNSRSNSAAKSHMNQVLERAITLAEDSGGLLDEEIAYWLDARAISEDPDLLERLGASNATDSISQSLIIENLRHIKRAERRGFYTGIAGNLIKDPGNARQLGNLLKLLPADDRLDVALSLIDSLNVAGENIEAANFEAAGMEGAVAFAEELLSDVDDIFSSDSELEAFVAIAKLTQNTENAARRITRQLPRLGDRDRRAAALELMKLDQSGSNEFTMQILQRFDDFHSISRPLLLEAILTSSQFNSSAIQSAMIDAIEDNIRNEDMQLVLKNLLDNPLLSINLLSRAQSLSR